GLFWSLPFLGLCVSVVKTILLRRRRHLHRPNRRWTHVHGCSVVPSFVPGFGSAEPVALSFIGGVINAPRRAIALVFQSIAQHQRSHTERGSGPDFLHLFIGSH